MADSLDDAFLDYQANRNAYFQIITNEARLRASIEAALGGEVYPTNLPPDRLQAYFQAQSALNDFYGGKSTPAFYAPIVSQLQLSYSNMAAQIGRTVSTAVKAPAFFAILNSSGEVIRRGKTEPEGTIAQVILPPNSSFAMLRYAPSIGLVHEQKFKTGPIGTSMAQIFSPLDSRYLPVGIDSDGDGLDDVVEKVIGTSPSNPDSDGDGIADAVEVKFGTNPLDGRPVANGVIASVDTAGIAKDVYASSGVAVVADGVAGVVIFNTVNSANPTRVAQVDTPGDATRVAGSGNLIAVADGAAGLAILDVTVPAQARIARQIYFGGTARAVAAAAGIAFVGTDGGQLVSVDMASGAILSRIAVGAIIHDFAFGGDALFVLTGNELRSFSYVGGSLKFLGTVSASAFIPDGKTGAKRLFVGGGIAYATSYPGYDTFSVTNPMAMFRLGSAVDGGFNAFKQIVLNGSGLGIAAVGVVPGEDVTHHISLYSVNNPSNTTSFITTLQTPGVARAVSIYNGLAYVADGESGLQVLNYLAYDTGTNPPAISLSASFPLNPGLVEEGKIARITANVVDDVQVRSVEFYIDGKLVATDGNFPFEYRFITPLRSAGLTNFIVQARAFDTGGHFTWADMLTVSLVPDATSPEVVSVVPANAAIVAAVSQVSVTFNEPINPATLTSSSFRINQVGADGLPGTADDIFISGGTISYNDAANRATLIFPTHLPPGACAVVVKSPVADLAGNLLPVPFVSRFWVTGGVDTDQDGIPDDIEPLLGLSTNNPDSNGNGIWDGDEDTDGDGLKNSWEILWGLNPLLPDSNGNSIADGAEDPDHDGLSNGQEQVASTNPNQADSDGDGWPDEPELTAGSDPLNPASRPNLMYAAQPPVTLKLAHSVQPLGLIPNTIVSRPPVLVKLPQSITPTGLAANTIVSRPPVMLKLTQPVAPTGLVANTVVAKPSVQLKLPQSIAPAGLPRNTTVASPPVQVRFANP